MLFKSSLITKTVENHLMQDGRILQDVTYGEFSGIFVNP